MFHFGLRTTSTLIVVLKLAVYSAVLASWAYAFPIAAQITDPARWLLQSRCADGGSPDHCQFPAPQRITDPAYFSRHDWPPLTGYCF